VNSRIVIFSIREFLLCVFRKPFCNINLVGHTAIISFSDYQILGFKFPEYSERSCVAATELFADFFNGIDYEDFSVVIGESVGIDC
jgi:hypothetical protein